MRQANHFSVRTKIFVDLVSLFFIHLIVRNGFTNLFSLTSATILLVSFPCWLFSGRLLGLYQDFRDKPFSIEWPCFVKTLMLYALLFPFVLFGLLREVPLERKQLLLHLSLIFILIPLQKLFVRISMKRIRGTKGMTRKVLIVGSGDAGMNFYNQYVKNNNYGYQLTGFVDEERKPLLNGHYLGKTSELENVIAKHELDDIIVAMPVGSEKQLELIVSVGEKEGKRIRIIPDFHRFGDGKMQLDQVGTLPIITIRSSPLDIIDNRICKRAFDIIFSLFIISFVFSWLFPIIAAIIKLTSKGPVFFKQERWGLNNKPIICYKFRSMIVTSRDEDENGNYQQASKNDPRVTRIGRLLRKTNLDELPQFFNVLTGSMSIVGPRPHPVLLNKISKGSVENYMMRHWVKPGITGWAQVHGYRGETRVPYLMQRRVEHDLWYIGNWTFWLDLQIVVQTLVNMVKGDKNAF